MSSFRDKIKAALVEALHTDPTPALSFIENFTKFNEHYGRCEMWELELAVREIYKGPLPFVWSNWDYGLADPIMSYEYEMNSQHVEPFEKLCVFIKEIEYYID
tara:strand:- start:15 stop:323 length:309 start_codon:yes stop_codon:yes gene_type:complete